MNNKITLGQDAGGRRHFLNGKPLHCGALVEVLFHDHHTSEAKWFRARFELDGGDPVIVFPMVGRLFPDSAASVRRVSEAQSAEH